MLENILKSVNDAEAEAEEIMKAAEAQAASILEDAKAQSHERRDISKGEIEKSGNGGCDASGGWPSVGGRSGGGSKGNRCAERTGCPKKEGGGSGSDFRTDLDSDMINGITKGKGGMWIWQYCRCSVSVCVR